MCLIRLLSLNPSTYASWSNMRFGVAPIMDIKRDMCLKETGSCVQNMIHVLSLIINILFVGFGVGNVTI